jgi:hypothetical protein
MVAGGIVLVLALGLVHLINYLVVKGIIFVVNGIFDYSLHGKFWHLYVGVILICLIFRPKK